MDILVPISIFVGCVLFLAIVGVVYKLKHRQPKEYVAYRPAPDIYRDMIRDAQARFNDANVNLNVPLKHKHDKVTGYIQRDRDTGEMEVALTGIAGDGDGDGGGGGGNGSE